jgi:hypothetical protein
VSAWPDSGTIAPSCTIQPSIQLRRTGPAPAQLCRYVPSFEEIPFHNEPFGESGTERSGAHKYHNHPSGVKDQSHADELITRKLAQSLAAVEVRLLDHLILAGSNVLSFAQSGLL